MRIRLGLNKRAFNAISNGSKTVEIRANKKGKICRLGCGDEIVFENAEEGKILCKVERVTLYGSVRDLLESEGTKKTLSSTDDLEKGIKSIHSISDYERVIRRNGVFAVKITFLKSLL